MIIFYFLLILFFLGYILIFTLNFKKENIRVIDSFKKFSIIIAAKNESKNIPRLISSLQNQTYPKEFFEVIIVDDNSSDDTYGKILKNIKGKPNFKILRAKEKIYEGKRGALQIGIDNAQNRFILITDADCIPAKEWIEKFNVKFDQGYDFIIGPAPFLATNQLVNKLARFENLWTHILTFSFAKLGFPYSATARNLGFKKSAFDKIGGYSKTLDTISGDDDLLLREAVKKNLRIGMITDPEANVYSSTPDNFDDYIHQKARHTSTSHHYLPQHKILIGLWHVINIFLLICIFLALFNSLFIYGFVVKLITDFLIVRSKMKILDYNFAFHEILYLQIFYDLMIVINFFNSFFLKVNWKSDS